MYYKASVSMATENLWLNEKTNEYEGCDPDSFQFHGEIQSFKASTLPELKSIIEKNYFNLEKPVGADVQIYDNRIEISYQGEHDYRTPKKEQIPFIETISIVISKVIETQINLEEELLFKNIPRN